MDDLGTWTEPSADVLEELTQHGCFAADGAVIEARMRPSAIPTPEGHTQPLTGAEMTEIAVRAALRMLLANGLIEAKLPGPEWVLVQPPTEQDKDKG